MIAATPIAFIRDIMLAYAKYGRDPQPALDAAHIAPTLLEDPSARVTAAQMERCSEFAMRELDDEALGWFSRRLPWGSYGMLCRASLTSPDLRIALLRWCRHHRLLTDDILLRLVVSGDHATLSIQEVMPLHDFREFCLLTTLRYALGYACWLIDSQIALRRVDMPIMPPSHAGVYEIMFGTPIEFNARVAALHFDAAYLPMPVRRDESALQLMLKRALPLTVTRYRRDRLLVPRVRAALQQETTIQTDAVALGAALGMSARTLHRHLQREGASLQALKDDVRRRRAEELLSRSHRGVKQIAAATGFRNEKSFIRAFRQWTGMTPIEFRNHGHARR